MTSLNINVRICQIEPHYSSEGIYSKNEEEQNLDWLSDNEMKFHDFICDNASFKEDIPLTKKQILTLNHLCNQEKNFCLHDLKEETALSIQKYLSNYARQLNKNCLFIHCSEIPEEILPFILCGYKKSIENNKTFERKGLFSKIKSGWIILSHFQKLSQNIQQNLNQIIQKEKDLHAIGMTVQKTKDFVFPLYKFPA